jgi:serine O-acetyltransferase
VPEQAVDAGSAPTSQEQTELDRFFETAEGRANFGRFLRETPEVRVLLIKFLHDDRGASLTEYVAAMPEVGAELQERIALKIRRRQAAFLEAVRIDAAVYASSMMGPGRLHSGFRLLREVVRLLWTHDTFFCQLLYRLRVHLFVRRVPILPVVLHRLCMILNQVDIGAQVLIDPGVYMPHGKVVIDGIVQIGGGTTIAPWATLGLTTSVEGPSIGRDVMIGTGAKILGPITVGDGARIAANAVVIDDVPPHTTVAGAPATVVRVRDQHTRTPVSEVR